MAGEKVELMRGLYADFRRGDTESAFEVFAEDIEWDAREVQMPGVGGLFRGHDAVRRFWRHWLEAWQEISWEEVEYEELADGRVRVLIHQRNRGRETGIWVDQPPYEMYWTVEEGVVTRMEYRWIH